MKIILIFYLFISFGAAAQVGFEEFYSEKQLKKIEKNAKSDWQKLEANGLLAKHYKATGKDSLSKIYLEKVRAITGSAKGKKLKARSLWWDALYVGDTVTILRYIDWATKNNLIDDEIMGYVELTRVNIHINLGLAENSVLLAKKRWDEWKADSISKDSLKLEVFRQLAHVYVHKKDGVKAVSYLLPLQDYANQDRNLELKELALNCISEMYFEWPGQYKKATEWMLRSYELSKKLKNPNKRLSAAHSLAMNYLNLQDTVKARQFVSETDRLRDSIGVYGSSMEWYHNLKYYGGVISREEYARLIDNNFDNKYALTPSRKVMLKLYVFGNSGMWDSVGKYLLLYEHSAGDSALAKDEEFKFFRSMYYLEKKQYRQAIPFLAEMRVIADKKASLPEQLLICKYQAQAAAGIQDYKAAYEFLDQAYIFKDSLERLGGKEEVSLMEMQKQEEMQTAAYKEEKKLIAAEQSRIQFRNRVRFYGLVAGLGILLLIAALLWRNSRQKQKANKELEKTLADLRTTQSQLVQSEKMASLGELTAGIAHEIQNPLNFVNNFSEVNTELIDELDEQLAILARRSPGEGEGNIQQARELSRNLRENEKKIIHHGNRADAIVKSMLQHSRSSSSKKELVDINALADEYLRLSYHGLRAKDSSFQAKFETSFDPGVGKVNVVPQEIGRVLLNLLNNAFYAVTERKKKDGSFDDPLVRISTQKRNGQIRVSISDNGNGIPKEVADKIFQPFFTTKPTGQGTGLGLSLSYDIIKAHGGELKLVSKQESGAEFVFELPANFA